MNIKVLYILNSDVMGGATISFLNMILGLRSEGIQPIVLLPTKKNSDELEEILQKHQVEYQRTYIVPSRINKVNISNNVRWITKYLYLPFQKKKCQKEIERIVKTLNPDIIHTNVGAIHEGFWVARKLNIPHIWHLREYQTKDFNWFIYPSVRSFKKILRQSYVITITDDIRNYFGLWDWPKARTIYNGIFHKSEISFGMQKEPYFLMASRVSKEKGHLDVIKAFSKFSRRDCYKLVIAGFGNEAFLGELEATIRECGCEGRVELLGFQNDVRSLMEKAKALIVASYNEGFGRMTAEANFCGTMVIGRETAGTKEILTKTGGLFFNTIEEMTKKMEEVSNLSDEKYLMITKNAQKKATELFSIESNISNVLTLYESVLKK